jgi:hypothetical protein
MIYLYETNRGIEPHTDKKFAENTLKLGEPIAELTEQEWQDVEGLARMIDGELFLGKTQAEKDEEKAQEIRGKRDRLLTHTDWTQTVDNPLAGNEDITAYRQALRDLTDQAGFPSSVNWPDKPSIL